MCFGGLGMADNSDNDSVKGSGNSFAENVANAITKSDGFSYTDGVLTADNSKESYGRSVTDDNAGNSISVANKDGTGFFSVDRDVTKGFNRGLIGSAVLGALTGGLPGIAMGIAGQNIRSGLKSSGNDAEKGGLFSRLSNTLSGKEFDTPEARDAYNQEQRGITAQNLGVRDGRPFEPVEPVAAVKPTVTTNSSTGIATVADPNMTEAAAQGAFQAVPNPNYDANDPASPRFLINPTYDQLLKYQQSKVPGKAKGGLAQFAEGGELGVAPSEGGNEKDMISDAVSAVKGEMSEERAAVALGQFLANYGEEALRNLVDIVQSGEFDETIERFANGEAGEVNGPGDGSGVDDRVPASLEGQQDVLLADGEFVLRKKTADALEKKYGGGFLDTINEAEANAPRTMREYMAKTA
tara:strand:- start:3355 stop:4584 length:1230 start_codon:yes stop_codon:yes gene_type:complete